MVVHIIIMIGPLNLEIAFVALLHTDQSGAEPGHTFISGWSMVKVS